MKQISYHDDNDGDIKDDKYTAGYFCVMMIVIEVADVQSPKVEAQSEEGQHSIRPDTYHHHQHCINIIT